MEERKAQNWATVAHLISLIGFLGIPFGNLIGPLMVWLFLRKDHALIDDQGKESLNFQITMTIYALLACLFMFIIIGFVLIFIVILLDIILVVVAAVKANDGERYRYPLTLRLIK